MKNFFDQLFFPAWFIRFGNGKFLMLETLFIYMVLSGALAAVRVTIEGKNGITGFQFIDIFFYAPFLLGIAFQIYAQYRKKIKVLELPAKFWKTQLAILSNPQYKMGQLSYEEKDLLDYLKAEWKSEYGISWAESRMVKTQKFIPWLLPIVVLITVWFFS